ncbi:MAG: 2-deoxyribose-5-phosphate aldolase [Saprospiraceae bacterium]|nr:MAG: 2-deoxyribose-5-phosphate aldolase [Saprospiraceae bacterium]
MDLARLIDHTLLKSDTDQQAIIKLCEEAVKHRFASVCVPPYWVPEAFKQLKKTTVKVTTVIGFPMGYSATAAKVEEIKRSIDEGADELDVVLNICAVKSGNWNYVRNDIDRTTTAVHLKGKQIKIIIETGLLTADEIREVCKICQELEPDFVKTSTGFNGPGASVEAVQLIRQLLTDNIKIKASGGIRSREDAMRLVEAGAQRLGSSSGIKIVTEM